MRNAARLLLALAAGLGVALGGRAAMAADAVPRGPMATDAAPSASAEVVAGSGFDAVLPGKPLAFPRDFGAHPGYRIEWWYVTGQLESARGPLGFQVTFFRVRNRAADAIPGRFSPRQLLFAHVALADPAHARFLHDQRAARALEGLVAASAGDTDVRIDDWTLVRESGGYHARVAAAGFTLDLVLAATQPLLLEGDAGFSRKGPGEAHASYYYSEPQLAASGTVRIGSERLAVHGRAWLDHEWSSALLAPGAAGWDWLGANLDDGSALMAFRIRAADGSVLWSQALLRPRGGLPLAFGNGAVRFTVQRTWTSPRTGVAYPVSMALGLGPHDYRIEPLMDDQELDARASTGTLYWEGAVRVSGAAGVLGKGYLELTGYGAPVPF
jgi:predicted secreted hydrolase